MAKDEIKENYTLEELQKNSYSLSDKVLSDLKYALNMDFTIVRACRYAGITPDTYYQWVNKSDEFRELMESAQEDLFNEAQKNVYRNITEKKDLETSQWFLERRDKKRYSKQIDQNVIMSDVNITIGDDKPDDTKPEESI